MLKSKTLVVGKANFKKTTTPKIKYKEIVGVEIVASSKLKVSKNKVNEVSKKDKSLLLLNMNIPIEENKGVKSEVSL